MNRYLSALGLGLGLCALYGLACTAAGKGSAFGDGNEGGTTVAPPVGGGGGTTTGTGGGEAGFDPGDDGGTGTICVADPDEDKDQDGFSINDGDCNDCDANVNPHAIEVMTDPEDEEAEPADENCNGEVDEEIPTCDDGLALDDVAPLSGARAMDMCHDAEADGFGVVSAQYVRANGSPSADPGVMVGLFEEFGPNVPPRKGARLLGISSGHARLPGQTGACGQSGCQNGLTGDAPSGFPQDVPYCDGDSDIYDDVALEVVLRAPMNANGYSFDFSFYTFEYPEFVCTAWNDQFIALVSPPPAGSINGNISFDSDTNPVSVNIAFFEVCSGCPLGTGPMQDTGFNTWNDAGATGWLVSTAPITGGVDFRVRFTIWDTGDMIYDSTTILDNFTWIANAGTVAVGTTPVPN